MNYLFSGFIQDLKIIQKINLIIQNSTYFMGVLHTFPWVRPTAIIVKPRWGCCKPIFQ